MTWTKLGDEFVSESHRLTDAAFRLHIEALIYSSAKLLDLTIPHKSLSKFHDGNGDVEVIVDELVDMGWWERRGDDLWIGVRWPQWQRSRAQVDNDRHRGTERAERHRRHRSDDHSLCQAKFCAAVESDGNAVTNAVGNGRQRVGTGRDGTGRTRLENEVRDDDDDNDDVLRCVDCGWPADSAEHYGACADSESTS